MALESEINPIPTVHRIFPHYFIVITTFWLPILNLLQIYSLNNHTSQRNTLN
jgi:hypothetical protein